MELWIDYEKKSNQPVWQTKIQKFVKQFDLKITQSKTACSKFKG